MKSADFSANKKLARHIEKSTKNGRPAPAEFRRASSKDRLSVNSLTVQTEKQIAACYALKWHSGKRPVRVATTNVQTYVENAGAVGIEMTASPEDRNWSFQAQGKELPGFAHTKKDWSISHCECNFTEYFSEYQDFKFAHRMAGKLTYKEI